MKLVGHENAISIIKSFVKKGKESDAYIFCGPKGVGKKKAAWLLAISQVCKRGEVLNPCFSCDECRRAVNKNHPSIIEVEPEGLSIKREMLKEVLEELQFKPYSGEKRFIIIDDAEDLTLKSANMLLKTIEEPPRGVFIILITSSIRKILPTIRSRCKHVYFGLLTDEEVAKVFEMEGFPKDEVFIRLADGSPGTGILLMKEFSKDISIFDEIFQLIKSPSIKKVLDLSESFIGKREELIDLLELFKHWVVKSKVYSDSLKMVSAVERIDVACREIRMNANKSLTITKLFIDLIKLSA
jgi:DNA polymerase-3 subunit delta'